MEALLTIPRNAGIKALTPSPLFNARAVLALSSMGNVFTTGDLMRFHEHGPSRRWLKKS
jgi:hypothetical protein